MDRLEALEKFKNKAAKDLVDEYKAIFEKNFKENKDKVKNIIINGLKKLIIKSGNIEDKNYKMSFFQFELLRSNILNDNYKILIHGYNALWYFDTASIYEEIDLNILFESFIELKKKLINEKKIYIGRINNYDVQIIIFDLVAECYKNMCNDVRDWFWDLDEENFMKEKCIEDFYTIKWSEYQGKSQTLFSMDNRQKQITELLALKNKPKEKSPFVYTVWKDSNLENAEFIKEDMTFINFKGSSLRKLNFLETKLIDGQFKGVKIKNCIFENSNLLGSSFENSVIEDSDITYSNCSGVNFSKSELNYVNFKGTNLKGAIFSKIKFKELSFEDAELENAIFMHKDIPFLHLTSEQLQTIKIEVENKR